MNRVYERMGNVANPQRLILFFRDGITHAFAWIRLGWRRSARVAWVMGPGEVPS